MKKTGNREARIPVRAAVHWRLDGEGLVVLETENTGWANRLAQRCFGRPKVSYIHLDEMGSFVWCRTDGETDLERLGELTQERFGEAAQPLYERLWQYFRVLYSYRFIEWTERK